MEISYEKQMSLQTLPYACLSFPVKGINTKKPDITGLYDR